MNNKTVISVILAMTLASGGLAFGQGNGGPHDRDERDDRGRHEQDQRQAPDRPPERDRGNHNERDAGPNHSWQRGERVPAEYRGHQYVVDDWRGHHLSAPPRGYHWVQNGGDYLLVAVATGVILQLLLNN